MQRLVVGAGLHAVGQLVMSCAGMARWLRGVSAAAIVTVVCTAVAHGAATPGWVRGHLPVPVSALWGELDSVSCSSVSSCVAVGSWGTGPPGSVSYHPSAERWDGVRWSTMPPPAHELSGVSCPSSTDCVAVGSYDNGARTVPVAEQWDGTRWSIQPTPAPSASIDSRLVSVSCTSVRACTAVGINDELALVEPWDGTRWSIQPTPRVAGADLVELGSVSCTSARVCMAVGWFARATSEFALAEQRTGAAWSIESVTTQQSSGDEPGLNGVSCSSGSACTAVGEIDEGMGSGQLIERWDGGRWSRQTAPSRPGPSVYPIPNDVSCPQQDACTAVGSYHTPHFDNATLAERWGGAQWAVWPSPTPGSLFGGGELEAISCPSVRFCAAVGAYTTAPGTAPLAETWERPLARAELAATPTACARISFTAQLRGADIASVRWSLDGKQIGARTVRRGQRYSAAVDVSPGRHRLAVRVRFASASHAPARVFYRTILGCPSPEVTG